MEGGLLKNGDDSYDVKNELKNEESTVNIDPTSCDDGSADAPNELKPSVKSEEGERKSDTQSDRKGVIDKDIKSSIPNLIREDMPSPLDANDDVKDETGVVGGIEDEFMNFMNEVEALPKSKPSSNRQTSSPKIPSFLISSGAGFGGCENGMSVGGVSIKSPSGLLSLGTGDTECERLTGKQFSSAFEVLGVTSDATEEELKKMFRKISLLIHPDKCKHPKAQEAFHIVTKAYEEAKKPEMRERYQKVLGEAKRRVLKERAKRNKLLLAKKEPPLPCDDAAIQDEVLFTCDEILRDIEERKEYAIKCRKANEDYEKKMEEELAEEEKRQKEQKRQWEDTRDSRVGTWREFRTDVDSKRVKLSAFKPVMHHKEIRTEKMDGKKTSTTTAKTPMGIDESYKKNWR